MKITEWISFAKYIHTKYYSLKSYIKKLILDNESCISHLRMYKNTVTGIGNGF